MNWRFWKTRQRAAGTDYAELVAQVVHRNLLGGLATAGTLGAQEVAAGMVGRAFATARIQGPENVTRLLGPSVLADIGRSLIVDGEWVGLIAFRDSDLVLRRVSDYLLVGNAELEGAAYDCTLAGPSSTSTIKGVPAAGVVHVRINQTRQEPWRGRSPLAVAASTGRLASELEQAVADELAGPRGTLIPAPEAGEASDGTDPMEQIRSTIAKLAGDVAVVESMSAGDGLGGKPAGDWAIKRLGFDGPESLIKLRTAVETTVLSCCGIPPELGQLQGSGTGRREALRVFLHTTLRPWMLIALEELSLKLEASLEADWSGLGAADTASKARAYKQFRDAGLEDPEARTLAGL